MTAGWGIRSIHCKACEDEFEPEGYVGEDGAFCSDDCEEFWERLTRYEEIYIDARYGSAPVF